VRPIVLSIAGSDCSGGAGIHADLKAIEAGSGFAATALTAVTVQTGTGVRRTFALEPALVAEQIEAVLADMPVAAVKSGMLAQAATVEAVAGVLARRRGIPFVLDPVLASESGTPLLGADAIPVLLARLVPLATLLTPNAPEAEVLTGIRVHDIADAERAARSLLARGAGAVLVKGGHLGGAPAADVLVDRDGVRVLRGEWLPMTHARGTGCILASAVAVRLAHGLALAEAVARAKEFVTESIRHGLVVGSGRGPADPFHAETTPRAVGRLHVLVADDALRGRDAVRLARIVAEAGADVVQLREKRPRPTAELVVTARAIREAIDPFGASLVIDDRADVAAAVGAAGVHLGAGDLDAAVARRLLGRGALVGRTANSLEEALRAASEDVDYLGVGPVFATTSKANPAPPLGVPALARIVAAARRPVVAIGGIGPDDVAEVMEAGVHGVAVLSAVADVADPGRAVARIRETIDTEVARRGCERGSIHA
jgi:hydroxymethylpyrimidine/phosphomethylpyrimidine kinase